MLLVREIILARTSPQPIRVFDRFSSLGMSRIVFVFSVCVSSAYGRLATKAVGESSVQAALEALPSEVGRGLIAARRLLSPSPAALAASPAAEEPQGLCGCPVVPADSCTCGASLSYLKCVEKKCNAGECDCPSTPFTQECNTLAGTCASELDIAGCTGQTTTCEGKFHQMNDGVVGLTLNTSHLSDEAYCGPHGKCTGELHVFARVHRPVPDAWFECILPAFGKNRLVHCDGELSSEGAAECTLPMAHELEPSDEIRGQCYLTEGQGGKKITRDAWFLVENRYAAKVAKKSAGLPKTVQAEPAEDAEPSDEMKSGTASRLPGGALSVTALCGLFMAGI